MRIQGVALEHHGDAAFDRRQFVHAYAANLQLAFADVFQARDRAQQRGLAAARGADKHDKLAVVDLQIDAVQRGDIAKAFLDVLEANRGHCVSES